MNHAPNPVGWQQKVWQALVLLLLVAVGARAAAELLAPLVPSLVALVLLLAIYWIFLGRRK